MEKNKQIFGLHRRGKRRKTFAMQRRWRTEKEVGEKEDVFLRRGEGKSLEKDNY